MYKNNRVIFAYVAVAYALLFAGYTQGEIPDWWVKHQVINLDQTTGDYAPANQGQAKYLAKKAYLEMEECFSEGAGEELDTIIGSFSYTDNYLPVNIGQLKYLAKPFYTRLIEKGIVEGYPWTETGENYSPANVGQLKNLFSFKIIPDKDSDVDGLPDAIEQAIGTDTALSDTDGDTLSDYWEVMRGWNASTPAGTSPNIVWRNDSQSFLLTDQVRKEEVGYWTWGSLPNQLTGTLDADNTTRLNITPVAINNRSANAAEWLNEAYVLADGETISVTTSGDQNLFSWNPNDSSDFHTGEDCLSITFLNRDGSNWTQLGMALRKYHLDVRAFSHLEFWMKYPGGSVEELRGLRLFAQFEELAGHTQEIELISYFREHFLSNVWFPVRIPWTDITQGEQLHVLTDIMFVSPDEWGGGDYWNKKIKLDDISLTTPLPASETAHLYVDRRINGPMINRRSVGVNGATWDTNLISNVSVNALIDLEIGMMRFPGGNTSDKWDWESNREYKDGNVTSAPHETTLDEYLNLADSLGMEKNFTVNYLSAEPSDATACASDIKNKGRSIDWWCIGNELYGPWQYELTHDKVRVDEPNPDQYAHEYSVFKQAIRDVFPQAKVGVCGTLRMFEFESNSYARVTDADTGYEYQSWSCSLLQRLREQGSSPDFYEVHYYPQDAGAEHDDLLLNASKRLALDLKQTRRMLSQFLPSGTTIPIQITEFNSVNETPGKQSVSLINAIYLTSAWAQGVLSGADAIMTWAWHDKMEIGNNNADHLDGDLGIYDGEDSYFGCYGFMSEHGLAGWEGISRNIKLPAYYAWQLVRDFALPGGHMILAHSDYDLLRIHACKKGDDINLMLINQSFSQTIDIPDFEMNRWSPAANLQIGLSVYDYDQYADNDGPQTFTWNKEWDSSWQDLQAILENGVGPLSICVITLQPAEAE